MGLVSTVICLLSRPSLPIYWNTKNVIRNAPDTTTDNRESPSENRGVSLHCVRQIKVITVIGMNRILNNSLFSPWLKSSFSMKVSVTYVQLLYRHTGVEIMSHDAGVLCTSKMKRSVWKRSTLLYRVKTASALNELLSSTAIATLLVFIRNYTITWCVCVSKSR